MELPENRRWLGWLTAANVVGALYGFNWYKVQLQNTPATWWPVVPDSPLAALYFGLFLLVIWAGWRLPFLEALAALGMFKYGLWTVVVLGAFMLDYGYDFEASHLILSHAIMAIESVIFVRYFYPGLTWGLAAAGWYAFNDMMDYFVLNTHPMLPDPALLPMARTAAVVLTGLALLVFVALGGRARTG